MSDPASNTEQREELAAAFDQLLDPLAPHSATFEQLAVDPFGLFLSECLDGRNPAPSTRTSYVRLIQQWRQHMTSQGRHPACPGEQHVISFARYQLDERENQPDTVRAKLRRLRFIFSYWQEDPAFPHGHEFNPFSLVLSKLDLRRPPSKQPPRIPVAKIGDFLQSVTNVRDRAMLATQFKLGLRRTELVNIQLADLHVAHGDIKRAYPEIGMQTALEGHTRAIYIPSRNERQGNKSRRPRVLPIDEELHQALVNYLLVRPDTGEPWLFLTKRTHNQVDAESVNRLWKEVFRPEYNETSQHRAVTSHYARHRFTTYWRVEQQLDRELIQYMRGDTLQDEDYTGREGIDSYIHPHYDDIEAVYRNRMFSLGISGST